MVILAGGTGFSGSEGFTASGAFRVAFKLDSPGPLEEMRKVGIAISGASVEAVAKTTEELKNAVRDFIDAHFSGSAFVANSRRRVSNASAQSRYYNELATKGQYTGLVYSKFGAGHGPQSFVDYLLTHVRGATISPGRGEWLMIVNPRIGGTSRERSQVGYYPDVDARVFFVTSRDHQKLYLLRSYGKGAPGSVSRTTQLLATLVRKVTIPARLSGLDQIARRRPELFENNFAKAFEERSAN